MSSLHTILCNGNSIASNHPVAIGWLWLRDARVHATESFYCQFVSCRKRTHSELPQQQQKTAAPASFAFIFFLRPINDWKPCDYFSFLIIASFPLSSHYLLVRIGFVASFACYFCPLTVLVMFFHSLIKTGLSASCIRMSKSINYK